MKTTLSAGVMVLAPLIAVSLSNSQTSSESTKPTLGKGVEVTRKGTVTKHGVDTCEARIDYDLHSADHKTTAGLGVAWYAEMVTLEMASKTGRPVVVKGTLMIDTKHCEWIRVSSVTE